MKTTIPSTNYIHRSLKPSALLFASLLILCLGFLPSIQAVTPAPDGGYSGANTAEGTDALFHLTTGVWNSAFGFRALYFNAIGVRNTAVGYEALYHTASDDNVGVGAQTLFYNLGRRNVAVGSFALYHNNTGEENVAIGNRALFRNNAPQNTAVGSDALLNNSTGYGNTAVGSDAAVNNTTGHENTAVGGIALQNNTTGHDNTAVGIVALQNNTTGHDNTAVGTAALGHNTTGNLNIGLGVGAGHLVFTASNVIAIGHGGADVSNTTWINNVFGVTTQSGTTAPVVISDGGQLGTVASSERFKKDIATMEKTSEAILSLRPVTFHYKSDVKETPQFGLIAEEVVKVNPALVLPDKEGKPFTVRYDAVNAMLLNEFLKEHRKVQELETTVAQLKSSAAKQDAVAAKQQKEIGVLTAGLKEQDSKIQKINNQIELKKAAPQITLNSR